MDNQTKQVYDAVKQKAKKEKKKTAKDSAAAMGQTLGMEGIIRKVKTRQKMLDDI